MVFHQGVFSLSVSQVSAGELLQEIARKSGIDITTDKIVGSKPVTLTFERLTLARGIDRIIEVLGLPDYAVSYKPGKGVTGIGAWVVGRVELRDRGKPSQSSPQKISEKSPQPKAESQKPEGKKTIDKEPFFDKKRDKYVEVVKGEALVRYRKELTSEQIGKLQQDLRYKPLLKREQLNVVRVKISDDQSVEEFIRAHGEDMEFLLIEPNFIASTLAAQALPPNDPYLSSQWALSTIQAEKAWQVTTGSPQVVVAILDTGIDLAHQDLKNKMTLGYDFVNGDADPSDDHGHGTHVAGIVAAQTNNSLGIAGVSWGSLLMPIKVITASGEGAYSDVIDGILYAADNGARVINLSIGGYSYSQILGDAVEYAHGKGVVLVAAGGNEDTSDPIYPAAYPNVIGVSATDSVDQIWPPSNQGTYIKLSAPGTDIIGPALGNGYARATGTSASTAHVSGVAALVLSKNFNFSNTQVEQILYQTADDLGEKGWDQNFGYGRLNAAKALEVASIEVRDVAVVGIRVEPETFKGGEPTQIIVTVQNQGTSVEMDLTVSASVNDVVVEQAKNIKYIKPGESIDVGFAWIPKITPTGEALFKVMGQVAVVSNEQETNDNARMETFGGIKTNNTVVIEHKVGDCKEEAFFGKECLEQYGKVHQHLADQARKLLPLGSAMRTDFFKEEYFGLFGVEYYLKHDATGNLINEESPDKTPNEVLLAGVADEDKNEADQCGRFPNLNGRYVRHGWNPDGGYGDGFYHCDSAIIAAEQYWAQAISLYKQQKLNSSYWWLGRVVHLMGDMSVPAHVHLDGHAPNTFLHDDAYEEWIGGGREVNYYLGYKISEDGKQYSYFSGTQIKQEAIDPLFYDNLILGGSWSSAKPLLDPDGCSQFGFTGFCPPYETNLPEDRKKPLFKLFLHLAELTDDYESDGHGGEGSGQQDGLGVGFRHACTNLVIPCSDVPDTELMEHAKVLMKEAFRHTAALYQLFWDTTHPTGGYTSPADGTTVGDSVDLQGTASSPDGIKHVEFTVNYGGSRCKALGTTVSPTDRWEFLSRDTTAPYEFTLPLGGKPEGWFELGFDVFAENGFSIQSPSGTICLKHQQSAPTVTVTWALGSPPNPMISGQKYSASWTVSGGSNVTHTHIHWDTDPNRLITGSALGSTNNECNSPCSPRTFLNSITSNPIIAPTAGTYYFIAHASVDGKDSWSSPIVVSVASDISNVNKVPNIPTNLFQYRSDGVTGMGAGDTTNERTVIMKGGVTDPDGNRVSLEVEIQRVGTGFSNTRSLNCSSTGTVPSGGTAVVICSGLADGQYHWQGRARDINLAAGNWLSAGGNAENVPDIIVAAQSAPVQPINYPPSVTVGRPNGGENWIAGSVQTILWSATDDTSVSSVNLFYSTDGGVNWNAIATGLANSGSYSWQVPNTPSTASRLRVIAYDGAGLAGEDISNGNFTISAACTPPSTPLLYGIGTLNETGAYTLAWSSVSGATSYTLQEATESSFTNPIAYSPTQASQSVAGKATNLYYYRVRSNNSCGSSGWSNTESIQVRINQPPNVPSNPLPGDGASNVSRRPTLSWTDSDPDGTVDYAVFFGSNPNDLPAVRGFNSGTTAPSYALTFDLAPGTTYYWSIKARDDKGLVTVGPVWRFTTEYSYADLVPTNLTVTGTVAPNAQVTLNLTVRNQGTFAAPGAQVFFYSSSISGGREHILLNIGTVIPPLAPGAQAVVRQSVTLTSLNAGQNYVDAWIDTQNYFIEGNLSNNTFSSAITYQDNTQPVISFLALQGTIFRTGNPYPIVFTVSDDIGVASLDFYSSLDNGTNWNVIATGFVPGVSNTYYWPIPVTFPLTNQLRIKMVAHDGSSNSAEATAGPYTIVSGAAPAVTLLSPNGGETWDLGSTQTIRWSANAPNGIFAMRLTLLYAGQIYSIADVTSNTTGSYQWVVPNSASFVTNNAKIRIQVEDLNANVSEDYSDAPFTIRDGSAPPPPPWTTPGPITTVQPGNESDRNDQWPAIATDAQGNTHLVYVYVAANNIFTTTGTITPKVMYQKRTGSTWSSPTVVYSLTQTKDANNNIWYRDLEKFKITVDSSGEPHIVWAERANGAITGSNHDDIYYTGFNGSSWSAPFDVSDTFEVYASEPAVAIGPDNTLHVVWRARESWSSAPFDIYYRKKDSLGSWSAISRLTAGGNNFPNYPSLIADASGNLHLVYHFDPADLAYMKWDGTSWSTPATVTSEAGSYSGLASDSQNNLHLAWYHNDKIFYRAFDGASWSSREEISVGAPGQYSCNCRPYVVIDAQDRPHVIWEENGNSWKVNHKVKNPQGWSQAVQLNLASQAPDRNSSGVAISPADHLHVVWSSIYSGHTEIFYNHADVSVDTSAPGISVLTPTSGETLSIGSSYPITWTATDNGGAVSIELKYTTDNGTTFVPIASGLTNTGTYSWPVPNLISTTVQIFATASDTSGNQSLATSGLFSITDQTAPTVSVLSPNGGESFQVGSVQTIRWTATDNVGVSSVDLFYSIDGGVTWILIASGEVNDGAYPWTVPYAVSTNSRVKVVAYDANGRLGTDVSNNTFTIATINSPPLVPHSPVPAQGEYGVPLFSTVNWSGGDPDAGDVVTYSVYFGTSSNPPLVSTAQSSSTYNPGALAASTTYYWGVVVSDGKAIIGGPLWSFSTSQQPDQVIAPTNLIATAGSSSQINLTWSDQAGNETGYKVERKIGIAGVYTEVATLAAGATAYNDQGLSGNTAYVYHVRAFSATTVSAYSNESAATTSNSPPATPSSPFPVDGGGGQTTILTLSWSGGDPDSLDTVTYDVYFGTSSDPLLVSVGQSLTSYTPETLSYQRFYYWRVVATDNHGHSASGPVWSFITGSEPVPQAPTGLTAQALSSSAVGLAWLDSSNNEIGFEIERKTGAGGGYNQINVVGPDTTSYIDSNLLGDTSYFYRVRAFNASGSSGYTNEANAITPPCSYSIGPSNASFGSVGGSGSVSVTAPSECVWTAGSNDSWITVTSGSSGNGNGAVNFSVASNTSSSSRTGTITIAGQTFTVTQAGTATLRTLTVSITGTGNIVSSQGGINCSTGNTGTCTASLSDGTVVTLTETPATVYTFSGWGGACIFAGTATTCTLTMNGDKSVPAAFALAGGAIEIASGLNLDGYSSLSIDNLDVYFSENVTSNVALYTLKKVSKNGGSITALASGTSQDTIGIHIIALDGFNVYAGYGGYGGHPIIQVPKVGGVPITLASPTNGYLIGVIGQDVYYGSGFSFINKVPVNGGSSTQLLSGNWVRPSRVDDKSIFFVEYFSRDVRKFDVGSALLTTLISGNPIEGNIFIDANNVYLDILGNIKKVSKNGGSVITIVNSGNAIGYVSDNTHVYFTENGDLKKVPVNGGTPTVLLPNANITNNVGSMAVDDFYLYWIDASGGPGSGKIMRILKSESVIQLSRTGQTTCYDAVGSVISCAGSGQDGEIQAGIPWPSPRFTDNSDGTVTDNLTGLMWTKDANLPGAAMTWQQALDYVAGMNAGTNPNSGYTDWRVPNVNELESPIDTEESLPALPAGYPFTNVQNFTYWSSTTYNNGPFGFSNAWFVNMYNGDWDAYLKTQNYYLWPVRTGGTGTIQLAKTGQTTCYDTPGTLISCVGTGHDGEIQSGVAWPSPRFTDHGDGTVTDNFSGGMWTKNTNPNNAPLTWQQALDYVSGMNFGLNPNFGFGDWRLPNRKELQSVIDRSQYGPALPPGHPFRNVMNTQTDLYWSSTTYDLDGTQAWVQSIFNGNTDPKSKACPICFFSYYVWPVRAGQVGKPQTPTANLLVVKEDSPDPAVAGRALTYTLKVTNNGPSGATGVTLTDTLPAGVSFVSATPQGTCIGTSPITCRFDLGSLASAAGATVTIVVTPTITGTISNTACVSGNENDPNTSNNCSTANTTVNPNPASAELSITKLDSPDPVAVGANLTYKMVVANNGPSTATSITLTDTLPSGVNFISASSSQGSCSGTTTITCNQSSLTNGNSATVTIVVTPTAAGTLTNTASASANEGDPNGSNNSATATTTVVAAAGAADLSVSKTDSPDPVAVGNSLSYTIIVTNNGPSRATGVTLTDILPAGASFGLATSSRGNCSQASGTVTCNIGRLGNGASATVRIVVTSMAIGTLTNTASVSGNQSDPVPGNNSATAITTVNAPSNNATAGSNVSVPLGNGVSVTFSTVTSPGETTINIVTTGPPLPTSFRLGKQPIYYGVNTTATFTGTVTICFNYDDTQFSRENSLKLFHLVGSTWTNVTTSLNTTTNVICGTTTSLSPFIIVEPDLGNLINISTRARVETADNVQIGGFIIGGSVPKTVVIRARGPSMSGAPFFVPGTLSNPTIQLYSGSTVIAQNDNWQTTNPLCGSPAEFCGNASDISATGVDPCQPNPGQTSAPPGCTQESAILVTLPPGGYTAIVSGVGGMTGVGLVEAFDVDTATSILINISTRVRVQTGDNVEIGGFIIVGTTPKSVLIRARGPSMGVAPFFVPGTLSNPTIQLYSGSTVIAQNNDWQTTDPLCGSPAVSCGNATQISATGLDPCLPNPGQSTAPPGCAQESVILVTLPPGGYTAIVSGVGGTTGVGLVEVFEVSP